jgi:hypothetical protein
MRRLAREHVVVERPERIQVRALIDRLAVDLLGRDELRDAGHLFGRGHRQREVDQLDLIAGEQDVLRCEVAVHDADLRGLDQRFADDLDQVGGLLERNRSPRADRLGERLRAVEQLDREPRLLTGLAPLAGCDHLRDAGTLHALDLLELALEALRDTGQ